MDFILEILFELYLGFAEIIVPEHKFKKWQETLLKVLCVLVEIASIVLLGAGIALLVENVYDSAGIALTSVGGALMLIQLIMFAAVLAHELISEKKNKKGLNE